MMSKICPYSYYLVTFRAITNKTKLCHIWSSTSIRAASYPHNHRLRILDTNLLSRWSNIKWQVSNTYCASTNVIFNNEQINTLLRTALILLRIGRIPRSASACAKGHSGKAGHAMEVKFRGSTSFGSYIHEHSNFSYIPPAYHNVAEIKCIQKVILQCSYFFLEIFKVRKASVCIK